MRLFYKFYKIKNKRLAFWISVVILIIGIIFVIFWLLDSTERASSFRSFRIDEMSDSEIINIPADCSGFLGGKNHSGEQSLGFDDWHYKKEDYDKVTTQYQSMSGMTILSATRARNCTVDYTINAELTKGSIRIVVIIDNMIVEDFSSGGEYKRSYCLEGTKNIIIKLLAEEAQFKVTVERKINNN